MTLCWGGFCDSRYGPVKDSLPPEYHEIMIYDSPSIIDSLRKLWGGFCYPSRDEGRKEAALALCHHTKNEKLVRLPVSSSTPNLNEDQAKPTAIDSKRSPPKLRTNIVATNQGRRKRVIRGLQIAFVALLAVVITLCTLHRLGYVADLRFSKSNNSENIRSGLQSRPLIKIMRNRDVNPDVSARA